MLREDGRLETPTFSPWPAGWPALFRLRPCGRLVDTGLQAIGSIPGSFSFSLRKASSSTGSCDRILLARYPACLATQLVRQALTNVAQRL
jgi:hypothetical protein